MPAWSGCLRRLERRLRFRRILRDRLLRAGSRADLRLPYGHRSIPGALPECAAIAAGKASSSYSETPGRIMCGLRAWFQKLPGVCSTDPPAAPGQRGPFTGADRPTMSFSTNRPLLRALLVAALTSGLSATVGCSGEDGEKDSAA